MTTPQLAADSRRSFENYSEFYRCSVYSRFDQQQFSGGAFGASILLAHQEPINLVDPALPEIVVQCAEFDGDCQDVGTDVGFGLRTSTGGRGKVFVAPANTEAHYKIDRPHSALCLAIPQNRFLTLADTYNVGHDCLDSYSDGLTSNLAAWNALQSFWRASSIRGGSTDLLLDSHLLKLIASLVGVRDDLSCRPEDERIARVIDYVDAHFGNPLRIEDLASIACLSPAHFSRVFKATVGEPVWTYVQRHRCERAREMLTGSNLALIEVAFRCGFSSQAHFTRSFKAHFGLTPGQIRSSQN